jgi:dTMP kinase
VSGRLIAFEGGEASGKSTQAALLADTMGAVLTREPGGTALGVRLRELVLEPTPAPLDLRAEALLMAADRAQHVAEVVRPALAAGRVVVSDRYIASSLAYQGFGRGLTVAEVRQLSCWATGGLEPDLVVLLEVPESVAEARLHGPRDRMEAEGPAFHRAVADGYRTLAAAEPERWVVIDGTESAERVAERVRSAVAERLGPHWRQ